MDLPKSEYAEQLIEAQILQGFSPDQALINVITPFIPVYKRDRLAKMFLDNTPEKIRNIIGEFSIVRRLNLSDKFLQKYFIYPSGRARPTMNFVHKTISDLSGKSVIVSTPENKTRPSYFYDGQNFNNLPNPAILDGPIYIPVIRYQLSETQGLFTSYSEYDPEIHCGTYYYYEPASDIFMLSNKTLVAPLPELAYYSIAGDDARNKLSNVIFPYDKPRSSDEQNYINNYLDQIENNQITNNYGFVPKNDIQQPLCMLAKGMDIEVIIVTYTMFINNVLGKTSTEIIDVRPRNVSYDSLYKMM
ncbi:Hypothetical protein HVR_LOCUS348 [uncultured virus]|nr:Hypothetical protein HVR_LOCUS348 [uncultured virus]